MNKIRQTTWAANMLLALCFCAGANRLQAQSVDEPYTFTTLAGGGGPGSADGMGSAARFSQPSGVATDASGNVYVADAGNHTIRKITPAGVVSTLAGLAGNSGSADGTGSAARFSGPAGVATDASGNVYVADTGNHTIRKITPAGVVSTLAGLAGNSASADGTGSAARFNGPGAVATDASGNVYVADAENHTIRQITPAGEVSTLAGLAGSGGSGDGMGSAARFTNPQGVATDAAANVYVADYGNYTIRKITPAGEVTTLAGLAGAYGSAEGTGSAARFSGPRGVATDAAGNVYVGDRYNRKIRKITPAGVVSTLAGAGAVGSVDGTGSAARFASPFGVATDAAGNVYVADSPYFEMECACWFGGYTIRKITPSGVVSTLAGLAGAYGSADGTGSAARFAGPSGVATDAAGNVYVADTYNSTIRKITPAGVVSTLAEGTGSAARFRSPTGVATDASGNVYVAEYANHAIRKITPVGVVTTLAGDGTIGSTDGAGSAARFYYPRGVATDAAGNVYVADTSNGTIRKITPAGEVTTLADDTGSAARFASPFGVAIDVAGNVYVAAYNGHTIHKITPAGVVTTLAGGFHFPSSVATDASGNVYVADTYNYTIRKITPTGVVTTLAGGYGSDDGTGSTARFRTPFGVATDAAGNVYVADTGNNGIRKGFPSPRFSAHYATANGGFVFQISGPTDRACQIETSTNLNGPDNWLPIYTNTPPFWYTNFDIGADPQRFYRATIRQ